MTLFKWPLLATALFLIPVSAQAEMDAAQKAEIEKIVREYILQNGDVLIESVNNFQKKQEEQANAAAQEEAKKLLAELKDDKTIPMAGNPDGDVIVVEFFDYNCGYCKKALEEIQSLLKEDTNVKVVFYDMPILGPTSFEMAKWSLAAQKQGKFFDFHQALMHYDGPKDEDGLKKLAKKAGLDADKLLQDKAAPEIETALQKHLETAQKLGIQGTPGFMINEEIFRGYIPYDQMKESIAKARGGNS